MAVPTRAVVVEKDPREGALLVPPAARFRLVLDALAGEALALIVTVGGTLGPISLGPRPPNVHIATYIPRRRSCRIAAAAARRRTGRRGRRRCPAPIRRVEQARRAADFSGSRSGRRPLLVEDGVADRVQPSARSVQRLADGVQLAAHADPLHEPP